MEYKTLSKYCKTDRQKEAFKALISEGSIRKAAKLMGSAASTISDIVVRVRRIAVNQGYSPEYNIDRQVPEPLIISGLSDMQVNEHGKPIWYKYSVDKEKQSAMMHDYVAGLCEEITPAIPKKNNIDQPSSDLMPSIFIGDAHIGMYAYGKETKHQDFDSDIATQQIREAIDYLVDTAEPAENGLLVNVGDFLHANGSNDQTFAGTPLDVDTRHESVAFKAALCMKYAIDRMLDKVGKVTVIMAKGNHDTDSSLAPRMSLQFYYMNEPRVNILDTDGFYHYIEYGNWLLGIHHGDKQKPESLAGSMARDMSQAWGRTTHRMWCVGHFHKELVKTLPGVTYRVFAALTPPDSWHASHGYKGDGEMQMLTLRRSGGIHSSHIYNIPQPVIEPDVTI